MLIRTAVMPIAPIQAACYSQRMLNPFHGVVNVVEIAGADAVSRDGEGWVLFVQGDREEALLEGRIQEVETPDVKFGTWTRAGGLRRAPVRYMNNYDYTLLDTVGSQLLEAVKLNADRIPFPLEDRFEFWLLDTAAQPLALLASACTAEETDDSVVLRWRPGEQSKRSFKARCCAATDTPHSELVRALVDAATGNLERAQWFHREADGSGRGLRATNGPELEGRLLPESAFPELLLRRDWPDADDRELVSEFLEWQAPCLLQLQHLAEQTRRQLEQAARRRAPELAARHRLIPEVVDRQAIAAALVEARLREAHCPPAADGDESDGWFPFFNE